MIMNDVSMCSTVLGNLSQNLLTPRPLDTPVITYVGMVNVTMMFVF